jgi:hypothetical protein
MPGLAKCWRRADISGVELGDDLGGLDWEVGEDPEMRRGCNGRFPGSRKGTGMGIIQERGMDWEGGRSEGGRGRGRRRGHVCVLER